MTSGTRKPSIDWQGRRIIAIPAALFVILAGLTAYLGVHEQSAFTESREVMARSRDIIETAQTLLSQVQDAETSQRGFLLTGDLSYLEPYEKGSQGAPGTVARLRGLVAGDAGQVARAGQLDRAVAAKLNELVRTIALKSTGRTDQARVVVISNAGEASMRQVRTEVAALIAQEERLLETRRLTYERLRNRTFVLIMIASLAAMGGLGYALSAMIRGVRTLERRMGERDEAEAARRESDALYRAMFANAADYLFVVDVRPDGRFILADVNPALEAAIGRPGDELRGRDYSEVTPPDVDALFRKHYADLLITGAPVSYQDPIETVEGGRIWETILAPVYDEGRIVRVVGCARDVSARARAEEQIRRAQRMEAVGQLTGGVAHDFNNLLQVIRANLEMLAAHLVKDEAATSRINSALRGADRAAELTRQLLAFARRQPLEPRVVNLGRLIGEMSDLLRRSVGESIEVETVIETGLWNTVVDPAQLESALLNLALNARDAMPGGGRLTVEAVNATLDRTEAAEFEDVAVGDYVMVRVRDSGMGMTPEVLARVFEPFFTTKGEEKGTGLGLSMVYGFVKQSRGHIQLQSEPGSGTTVRMYLPRSERAEDRTPVPAPPPAHVSDTVLVVEDDAGVRAAACSLLEELGYRCLEAEDGESALKVLENGADVQLLFTDVVMPGPVKGAELVARARALNPLLPVLFTSGFAQNVLVREGRIDQEAPLLSKPYGREELSRKIQAALRTVRPVVLVVEDDPLVRLSALDMVEDLGFSAIPAAAAGEAMDILRGEGRVDILFTDIGLPDVRGNELARSALGLRPELKVVFASGYADDGSAPEGSVWLSKPYEQRELSEALLGFASSWSAQRLP